MADEQELSITVTPKDTLKVESPPASYSGAKPLLSVDNGFGIQKEDLADYIEHNKRQALSQFGGVEAVAKALKSSTTEGLTMAEVSEERVAAFGKNELPAAEAKSLLQLMVIAYKDPLLIILSVVAVLSAALGLLTEWRSHGWQEALKFGWIEGAAIMFAVALVVGVGSVNDYKKEQQFRALNAKKNDKEVKVIRDGQQRQVSTYGVQVGDVVMIDTGDILCADGCVIESSDMLVDESGATGESDAIKKGNTDGRDPFFLSGTQVIQGTGRMLVLATGETSFGGKLMMALRVPGEATPLEKKMEVLADMIGRLGLFAALLLLVLLTLILLGRTLVAGSAAFDLGTFAGAFINILITTITIVVVAVPEGLPLAVTISLAYATRKMQNDNNLVRHLDACETMGNATAICSDKTGTLTQNVMTVTAGMIGGVNFEDPTKAAAWPEEVKEPLAEGIAVNSTAYEGKNDDDRLIWIGSKTEVALLGFARTMRAPAAYDYSALRKTSQIVKTYPFSSANKRMSAIVKRPDGQYRLYMKGASEIVLGFCAQVINGEGRVGPMDADVAADYKARINEMATQALRTICLAYVDLGTEYLPAWDKIAPEDDLVCLGLTGIMDPLRPEVPAAVATCQKAGIKVRMVTGDNIVTASNIAKKCGIFDPKKGGIAMEGPVFRKLTTAQLDEVIPNLQVLARSSPKDKQILVGRLKELGEVVAVTGDGTNDGPALKMAHVGFAMGITGTDVAQEAADIILMDDNFSSLVKAVLWGRNVFDSIRKFLQFQLTVNLVAVSVAFVGAVGDPNGESPLKPVQLLWVNLIMDTFAALALATEPPHISLLDRPPAGPKESLISLYMWRLIGLGGLYQFSVSILFLYVLPFAFDGILPFGPTQQGGVDMARSSPEHYTIIFNTFVFQQIFNEFNARKLYNELNMFKGVFSSPAFMTIVVGTSITQVLIVLAGSLPGGVGAFMQRLTGTAPLSVLQWSICIFFGALSLPVGVMSRLIPYPREQTQTDISFIPDRKTTFKEAAIRVQMQQSVIKQWRGHRARETSNTFTR